MMQPPISQIEPGAVVLARDGFIGTVEQVLPAQAAGQPAYFVTAPNPNGDRLLIPLDLVDPQSQPGEVYLRDVFQNILPRSLNVPAGRNPQEILSPQVATSPGQPAGFVDTGFPDKSHLTVPIVEERLQVGKRTVELGNLEIRKTVEEVQDGRRFPLTFDEVDVEHVAVNKAITTPQEPRYEGDVLIIPVMEEVLVIEKRLMLKEEIHIRKRPVVREQQIVEPLRREHVEIINPNNDLVTINDFNRANNRGTSAEASEDSVNEVVDADLDPAETGISGTMQPTLPNQVIPNRSTINGRPPVPPESTITGRPIPPENNI